MFSLNTQPIEKQTTDSGFVLDVANVWFTIQGEGPLTGRPAVFVRLAGCNLQCPGCDTNYTRGRAKWEIHELAKMIEQLWVDNCKDPHHRLVVLTGGEPFRQNIGEFVRSAMHRDFLVQIETNGTLYQDLPWYGQLLLVCSPKAGRIDSELEPHISHYKYVLRAGEIDEGDGLPTSVLGNGVKPARPRVGFPRGKVYVQPMDEGEESPHDPKTADKNKANLNATVESAVKYGYTMSIQLHKLLGLE